MASPLDLFSHWRVVPNTPQELRTADVVLTHEFGDQHTVSGTTRAIVWEALKLCQQGNLPLICQFPGHQEAAALGLAPVAVIYEHRVKGAYLDTHEVNRQVVEICRQKGWQRVAVCTHPHHVWRAAADLKRQGLTPLIPDLRDVTYDPTCSRREVATKGAWVPREILARFLYLVRGWI